MSIRIVLPLNHTDADLERAVEQQLGEGCAFRILKRSIDARQHWKIKVEYSLSTDLSDPADAIRAAAARQRDALDAVFGTSPRPVPVVVGTGPGGIFCALWLRLHGFAPVVLEQGPPMRERVRDMARFMKRGDLDPYSNICFGAGGAGTYSDGKLITRIRSPFISFVMATFVEAGGPGEIRYLYNPHLGSNRIRQCITRLLDEIGSEGAEVRYRTRLTGFTANDDGTIAALETTGERIDAPAGVFLATGHSSRETYAMLRGRGVLMDMKDFAVGVRVEHPAGAINDMQYGEKATERYPGIETAQYRLAKTWKEEQRAVYSFCMCPGGYVLNASTDANGVVTNGMSNALKSGRFSNAAVVVNVSRADLERRGFTGVDAALQFQSELEAAFRASVNTPGMCNVVPGQRLGDFLQGRKSASLLPGSCANPMAGAPLHALLPSFVTEGLRRGFTAFDGKMKGFSTHPGAQVFGAETRTSSPYRILRDAATFVSPTHPNLYPVGEGAGFAGGITSAAVDGIRCAQAFIGRFIEAEVFEKPRGGEEEE
ncbi:MAG: hypothetical protein IPP94_07820 [Ignavibacteria bacterium]|nr:hypothetical protein [Ignavibacteria bacterium]